MLHVDLVQESPASHHGVHLIRFIARVSQSSLASSCIWRNSFSFHICDFHPSASIRFLSSAATSFVIYLIVFNHRPCGGIPLLQWWIQYLFIFPVSLRSIAMIWEISLVSAITKCQLIMFQSVFIVFFRPRFPSAMTFTCGLVLDLENRLERRAIPSSSVHQVDIRTDAWHVLYMIGAPRAPLDWNPTCSDRLESSRLQNDWNRTCSFSLAMPPPGL